MEKINVFISFSEKDKDKVTILSDKIRATPFFNPIVVTEGITPSKLLSEKVIDGIKQSAFFIPILTSKSKNEQWINQEIGFVFSIKKIGVLPLVEFSIVNELKGFVHNQIELFTFNSCDSDNNSSFTSKADTIIDYLIKNKENVLIKPTKLSNSKKSLSKKDEEKSKKLIEILKIDITQDFLKSYPQSVGFRHNKIKPIDEFIFTYSNILFTIKDKTLKQNFDKLNSELKEYKDKVSSYMVTNSDDFYSIQASKATNPEQFYGRATELNELATLAYKELEKTILFLVKNEVL